MPDPASVRDPASAHDATLPSALTRLARASLPTPAVRVWAWTALLTCLTVLVWWVGVRPLDGVVATPVPIPWPVVALGVYLAEVKVVQVHFRRETHSFSLSEVPSVIGLFLLSSGDYVLAVMLGSTAAMLLHNRAAPIKFAFNFANFACIAMLSVALFHILAPATGIPGPREAAAAFVTTLTATVFAALSIATVISLSGGAPQYRKLPEMIQFGGLVALANTSLAVLGVTLLWEDPSVMWLLVPPVVAVYVAYRAYVSEREKHERLELLYESSRILQRSPQLDTAIVALLEHVRDMFRAEITELYLYPADQPDALVRTVCMVDRDAEVLAGDRRVAGDPIAGAVHPGDAAFFWTGTPLRLGDGRPVRQAMVSPLSGEHELAGVLIVANRMGEGSRYGEDDLRLLETLANQAGVALENGQLEQSLAELSRLKEQLRHLAYHDALTGMPNRTLFADRVEDRLRDGHDESLPVILFLDLDDFKIINDTLGHEAGDRLLASVAERISRSLRADDLGARMGGDEFAVLLAPDTTIAEAVTVAQRLLDELGSPFLVSGTEVLVGASVGIARGSDATQPAFELLRNADIAMYTAKSEGKRRFAVFEPTLHAAIIARHEMSSELARGVLRDELEVWYQPIVSIADERIVGLEALVRWNHPTRGVVGPDEFIRLAEDNGTILALGHTVMAMACRQVHAWNERLPARRRLVLNVNLSPRQVQQVDFVDEVAEIVRESGLPPGDLVLEMTETAMFQDTSATVTKLSELKTMGIRISVDDFGTGYSSLGYLRRFPVDSLKIARDFVSGDAAAPLTPLDDRWVFAAAIIALGRSLGLSVVAEGVETREQLKRLRAMGCHHGQGFLFSEALPPDEMEAILFPDGQPSSKRPAIGAPPLITSALGMSNQPSAIDA